MDYLAKAKDHLPMFEHPGSVEAYQLAWERAMLYTLLAIAEELREQGDLKKREQLQLKKAAMDA